MEKLYEILEELQPEVDFTTCRDLVDGHYLDSLSILSLVAELEDAYDIEIEASEMTPENFNSAEAIYKMVQRLQEN